MSVSSKGAFRFALLPRELQAQVATHLPLHDLKNLSLASKAVRAEAVGRIYCKREHTKAADSRRKCSS